MSFLNARRSTHAFTMIELIVVVVILSILALIAGPMFKKVMNTSHLQSAEVTAAALVRETFALSDLDNTSILSEETITLAAKDLPGSTASAPGLQADMSDGYQVVFGTWEFSGNERTLSIIRGGTPVGSTIGVALTVPDVGCAFAKSEGRTVTSWSVAGIDPANCNGADAFVTPETLLELSSPPTPIGLEVTFGCITSDGETGWNITFDTGAADVFLNGKHFGQITSNTCVPGTPEDTIVVVPSTGSAPGWEGGVGDLYGDNVEELPALPSNSPTPETSPLPVASEDEPETPAPVISDGGTGTAPVAVLIEDTAVVTWSAAVSTSNAPVSGYNVYRTIDGSEAALVETTDKTTTTASDGPLDPGTYCYQLSSYGLGGESPQSLPACVMLQPVANETAPSDTPPSNVETGNTNGNGSEFGYSVDIDGNTMLVGSPTATNDTAHNTGAAYLFTKNNGIWSEQAKLTADDGATGDRFGHSVATHGNKIIVGAPFTNDKGIRSGSVYTFTQTGSSWTQTKILASSGAAEDQFGSAVALRGNTLIVGAPLDTSKGLGAGAAYILTQNGSSWNQTKLTAADGATGDQFGRSVAIRGNMAVVGAPFNSVKGVSSGSAYIFNKNGTHWNQSKLVADDGVAGDQFGHSVAVHGNTIVVGAPSTDAKGTDSGSAYIFNKNGTRWNQTKLGAADGAAGDQFGYSVAIHGASIVLGARNDDGKGSAYTYTKGAGAWDLQTKLAASDGSTDTQFGRAVAINGSTILVGAPTKESNSLNSEAAYIFTQIGNSWALQTKLTPMSED